MRKYFNWTPESIQILKDEYPSSNNVELANKIGTTLKGLYEKAYKLKIKKESKLLDFYFDETPASYYWYGFITADGCLQDNGQLKVKLSIKDESHLNKLANYIGVKCIKNKKEENICLCVRDHVYGKLLKEKIGIKNPKTYNPSNLNFLDNEWKFLSFLCGLIDGDGHIRKKKNERLASCISIVFHKNWLGNFYAIKNQLFDRFGIESKTSIRSRTNCYDLTIYKFEQLKYLKLKFMELNLPFLNRKWDVININETCLR